MHEPVFDNTFSMMLSADLRELSGRTQFTIYKCTNVQIFTMYKYYLMIKDFVELQPATFSESVTALSGKHEVVFMGSLRFYRT